MLSTTGRKRDERKKHCQWWEMGGGNTWEVESKEVATQVRQKGRTRQRCKKVGKWGWMRLVWEVVNRWDPIFSSSALCIAFRQWMCKLAEYEIEMSSFSWLCICQISLCVCCQKPCLFQIGLGYTSKGPHPNHNSSDTNLTLKILLASTNWGPGKIFDWKSQ